MVTDNNLKKQRDKLIHTVVERFVPAFAPGGAVLYRSDRGETPVSFDIPALGDLGISEHKPTRVPDIIIQHATRNRLFLIDTVPGYGPINANRRDELAQIFTAVKSELVFVTAFLTRCDMANCLAEISWETEAWFADSETHLIHFDGGRLLGPYGDTR